MRNLSQQLRILIALTVLAVGGIATFAWRYFLSEQNLPAVRLVTVDVGIVSASIAAETASAIQSCQSSELKSDLAATVSAIHIVTGDRVARDTDLIELDNQTLHGDLARARNALAGAHHALEASCSRAHPSSRSIDVLRRQRVAEAAQTSSQPFDDAAQESSECVQAKEFERTATLQLRDLRTRMALLHVQAPFDGIVTEVAVQRGQAIAPGSMLLRVADSGCLNVSAKLPVEMGKRLQAGAKACVGATVSQLECSARLISIGVGNDSDHAEANIELTKLPPGVNLGDNVSVLFPLGTAADVTRVPLQCLARDGSSVFQLDAKRATVVRQPLRIGLRGDDYVEVRSGIAPGQRLVMPLTGTLANLKDGAAVHVIAKDK